MNLDEFEKLPSDQQYYITFTQGHFITTVIEGHIKKVLYEVFLFYTEVSYDSYQNKVIHINSFDEGDLLTKNARFISNELK